MMHKQYDDRAYFLKCRRRYEHETPTLLALDRERLERPKVNPLVAVRTALEAVVNVKTFGLDLGDPPVSRPELAAQVESGALALWYAHAIEIRIDANEIPALAQEGRRLRAELLVWLRVLARTGHLERSVLAAIPRRRGHVHLASGLVASAEAFHNRWDDLENKTGIDEAQVARAAELGESLMAAVVAREAVADPKHLSPRMMTTRALMLLDERYDTMRRAVAGLRWQEGDSDVIAPSFYAVQARGRAQPAKPPASPTEEANDATAAKGAQPALPAEEPAVPVVTPPPSMPAGANVPGNGATGRASVPPS